VTVFFRRAIRSRFAHDKSSRAATRRETEELAVKDIPQLLQPDGTTRMLHFFGRPLHMIQRSRVATRAE
jgi:hypothetical protein